MIQDFIIHAVTLTLGFIAGNWKDLSSWRNINKRAENSLYDEMQKSLRSARQDILDGYSMFKQLEEENMVLQIKNATLTTERDAAKLLCKQWEEKATHALAKLDDLERKLEEFKAITGKGRNQE